MSEFVKIRGFPGEFSDCDKRDFLVFFEATEVFVQKDFCIARFKNAGQSEEFISKLHQKKVLDSRLRAEFWKGCKVTQTANSSKLRDKPKSLHSSLDLRYNYVYPKPTREIIEAICTTLESVPRFYTQVLHLMNRMNLPPPFSGSSRSPATFASIATQTDSSYLKRPKTWKDDLCSDESEIDSDGESASNVTPQTWLKRKRNSMNLKPSKKLLLAWNRKPPRHQRLSPVKDSAKAPKFKMVMPSSLPVQLMDNQQPEDLPESPAKVNQPEAPVIDFSLNRLPRDQMSNLPVFKDYSPGLPSNKLYIKNLAKSVTEEDLRVVFQQFSKKSQDEIDVRLMTSGRMKGQAFVTFNTPYDEEDSETGIERMVARALRETNGYILRDKPMVVMYGKGAAHTNKD